MIQMQVIGYLGNDAEIKQAVSNGHRFIQMNVATSERRKDRNGAIVDETTWITVIWYNADNNPVFPYLKKGKQVFVSGSGRVEPYVDKSNFARVSTTINANVVQLLGKAEEGMNR